MKKFIVACFLLMACDSYHSSATAHDLDNNLVGANVIVHLDNNTGLVQGTLVEMDGRWVTVRLSNGKLYSYPVHRVSGVEAL